MSNMVRFSAVSLRIVPVMGLGDWAQIDRVQNIDNTGTSNREEIEEVGTDGTVDWVEGTPNVPVRLTQKEYGKLDFFRKIANVADSDDTLTLSDFSTSVFDFASYLTKDGGTFLGTLWIPKARVSGFSITIGSPTAQIERSFDFISEDWINWQGDNKYLIFKQKVVESGDLESLDHVDITVSDPVAVADPKTADVILRVVKITALGVATELTKVTDYSYAGGVLTVDDCTAGETIKYWYTATTFIGGETVFTTNTSDVGALKADCADLFLVTGGRLTRIQSVTIDVKLDRADEGELGNPEKILFGVNKKTVTITIGKLLETYTLEEALSGQVAGFGKLSLRDFADDNTIKVKIYTDNTKDTFSIGYKAINLAISELKGTTAVGAYTSQGNTLTGQSLTISEVEGDI